MFQGTFYALFHLIPTTIMSIILSIPIYKWEIRDLEKQITFKCFTEGEETFRRWENQYLNRSPSAFKFQQAHFPLR